MQPCFLFQANIDGMHGAQVRGAASVRDPEALDTMPNEYEMRRKLAVQQSAEWLPHQGLNVSAAGQPACTVANRVL
jgi:hypothetical protein